MDQNYIPFQVHTKEQQIVLIHLVIQEDSLAMDIQVKVDIKDN